jgi:hypothetical protein
VPARDGAGVRDGRGASGARACGELDYLAPRLLNLRDRACGAEYGDGAYVAGAGYSRARPSVRGIHRHLPARSYSIYSSSTRGLTPLRTQKYPEIMAVLMGTCHRVLFQENQET